MGRRLCLSVFCFSEPNPGGSELRASGQPPRVAASFAPAGAPRRSSHSARCGARSGTRRVWVWTAPPNPGEPARAALRAKALAQGQRQALTSPTGHFYLAGDRPSLLCFYKEVGLLISQKFIYVIKCY